MGYGNALREIDKLIERAKSEHRGYIKSRFLMEATCSAIRIEALEDARRIVEVERNTHSASSASKDD
jgi:hypothetical protein